MIAQTQASMISCCASFNNNNDAVFVEMKSPNAAQKFQRPGLEVIHELEESLSFTFKVNFLLFE